MAVSVTGWRAGWAGPEREAEVVAMFDTVTGWAFGPVFDGREEARRFMEFAGGQLGPDTDIRAVPNVKLEELHRAWLRSEGRTVTA